MAAVILPNGDEIRARTGWNISILNSSEAADRALLTRSVLDAADETALAVGEAAFDGAAWTTRQASALQGAICFRTVCNLLVAPEVQKLTGTMEPLLMEETREFEARIETLRNRAMELEQMATAGPEQPEPFALPQVSSGTFSVGQTDRRPSDKIRLGDVRDDVDPFNVEVG